MAKSGSNFKSTKPSPTSVYTYETPIHILNPNEAKVIYTFKYLPNIDNGLDFTDIIGLKISGKRVIDTDGIDKIIITTTEIDSDEIDNNLIDDIPDNSKPNHTVSVSFKPPYPKADNTYVINKPFVKFKFAELQDDQPLFEIYSMGSENLKGVSFTELFSINMVIFAKIIDDVEYLIVKAY